MSFLRSVIAGARPPRKASGVAGSELSKQSISHASAFTPPPETAVARTDSAPVSAVLSSYPKSAKSPAIPGTNSGEPRSAPHFQSGEPAIDSAADRLSGGLRGGTQQIGPRIEPGRVAGSTPVEHNVIDQPSRSAYSTDELPVAVDANLGEPMPDQNAPVIERQPEPIKDSAATRIDGESRQPPEDRRFDDEVTQEPAAAVPVEPGPLDTSRAAETVQVKPNGRVADNVDGQPQKPGEVESPRQSPLQPDDTVPITVPEPVAATVLVSSSKDRGREHPGEMPPAPAKSGEPASELSPASTRANQIVDGTSEEPPVTARTPAPTQPHPAKENQIAATPSVPRAGREGRTSTAVAKPAKDSNRDPHRQARVESAAPPVTPAVAPRPKIIEVPRTPEVRIGQVDVFVSRDNKPASRSDKTPRPAASIVSRFYTGRF